MKSTLIELSNLINQWDSLRKQRPAENELAVNLTAKDIDGVLASWKQDLEKALSRTRSVDQAEEAIIDTAVAKLIHDIVQHLHQASQHGLKWIIQNTSFMPSLASVGEHLYVVLAKRTTIRNNLLRIAESKLNDDILSLQKNAPIAQEIVAHFDRIEAQKESVDELVESAESIKSQLDGVKQAVLTDQTTVSELLATATENQDELKRQTDVLAGLIRSAQETLGEIEAQKLVADKKIANGAEQVTKASEQLSKALQDINKQGLAGAFQSQAAKISGERGIWVFMFLASIFGLCLIGSLFISGNGGSSVFDPISLLRELPFTIPIIWLGWFSARQISISSRIQQDYAYKASTAVAFEGYKKEVASANDEELLKKLLETAITNFGANPVRLYDNKGQDHGHPMDAFIEKIRDKEDRKFLVDIINALTSGFKKS